MSEVRKRAYLALLTTSLIWGLAPPVIKYSLYYISPLSFLFYRFLIVSLVLAIPLCLKVIRARPQPKDWAKYLFLGFLGTPLTLIVLFYGIQKTTAIDSSIIGVITPILVILGGAFFLKEKITKQERSGIFLILLGTLVTIIQPILETGQTIAQNLLGNTLVFLSTLSWAAFSLLSRKEKALDPFILTASSFILGLLILLPVLTVHYSLFTVHFNALPGILYMALLGSVIAYFTYIYGFSKIEASEATLFTYLQPLFAVPISVIFLKEKITPPFAAGAILIVAGLVVCETRRRLTLPVIFPKIYRRASNDQ